jgi:hypothetical protein
MSTKLNLTEINRQMEISRLKNIKENTNDAKLKESINKKLEYINKQKTVKK